MNLMTGKAKCHSFSLPSVMSEALRQRARAEDRGLSRIVQKALEVYLRDNSALLEKAALGRGCETT